MLKSEIDRCSELIILCEDVNEEDLADGAGEVILSLIKSEGDRPVGNHISNRIELMEAVDRLPESSALLAALRLLWAGYYRSLIIEAKHRCGEAGYRSEAIRRFGEVILKKPLVSPIGSFRACH